MFFLTYTAFFQIISEMPLIWMPWALTPSIQAVDRDKITLRSLMSIPFPLLSMFPSLVYCQEPRTGPTSSLLMVLVPLSDLFAFHSLFSPERKSFSSPLLCLALSAVPVTAWFHAALQHRLCTARRGLCCGWDSVLDLCAMVPGRWNLGGMNHSGLGVLDHIREQKTTVINSNKRQGYTIQTQGTSFESMVPLQLTA